MKNKISFEEHGIIGMICKMLNYKLLNIGCEINNVCKNKTIGARKSNHWFKANDFLSKFKDHIEEIMFKDYPKQSTTDIYYGSRKEDGDIIKWLKKYLESKKDT